MEETLEFGKRLSHVLTGGDVLALSGDLGVGKTLLTRGIALGLGIPGEQVTSPTFTLIQTYESPIPVIHVDLYRLENPEAIFQLGLEDYFTPQNIVIIEWADRLLQALPPDHLTIHLEHGETETIRHLTIRGTGPRSTQIVTALHSIDRDRSISTNPSTKN
jgi:tRNA threonylcarbamoyladenosine biosynthesis protein TsaE